MRYNVCREARLPWAPSGQAALRFKSSSPPTRKNLPEILYCNPSGPMFIWNYSPLGVPVKILIADDNLRIRQVLRPSI